MTIWYRVHQLQKSQFVFSGEGGLYAAGRWNHLGKKVVYASASIALCTLEWLSHHGLSVSGFNYYRYSIEIPDDLIIKFKKSELPIKWNATPSTNCTRDFAKTHLFSSAQILAMAVPSVVVPEEFNLVINPLHSEYQRILKSVKNLGQFIAPVRS